MLIHARKWLFERSLKSAPNLHAKKTHFHGHVEQLESRTVLSVAMSTMPAFAEFDTNLSDIARFDQAGLQSSGIHDVDALQGHAPSNWELEHTSGFGKFDGKSDVFGNPDFMMFDHPPSASAFSNLGANFRFPGGQAREPELFSVFVIPSNVQVAQQNTSMGSLLDPVRSPPPPQVSAAPKFGPSLAMGFSVISVADLDIDNPNVGYSTTNSSSGIELDNRTLRSNDLSSHSEVTDQLSLFGQSDSADSLNADYWNEEGRSLAGNERDEFLTLDDPEQLDESTDWLDLIQQELTAIDKVLSELHDLDLRPEHKDHRSDHEGQESKSSTDAQANMPHEGEPSNNQLHGNRRDRFDVKHGGMVLVQASGDANIGIYDLTPTLAISSNEAIGATGVETQIGTIQEVHVGTATAPNPASGPATSLRAALERAKTATSDAVEQRTHERS